MIFVQVDTMLDGVSSKESDSITFLAKIIILLLDFSHSFFSFYSLLL